MKKRIASLLLTLCMVLSLLPTAAFAAEEQIYLALGDSISAGYGIADEADRFTNIVAAERGYKLINRAVNGNTVEGIVEQFATGDLDEDIAQADFITITVGGNDLLYPVFTQVVKQYNTLAPIMRLDPLPEDPKEVMKVMTGSKDIMQMMLMFSSLNTVLVGDKTRPPYAETEECAESLEELQSQILEMMVYIRTINTTANVVITTQYHPYRAIGTKIPGLDLGKPVDNCALKMREAIYESAEVCGFLVADVYTTFHGREGELCNAYYKDMDDMNPDFHPNVKGQAVIAETVLAVELPEVPQMPPMPHVHDYKGAVTTEASCTEKGEMTYSCECGDSYTEAIPALGHKAEEIPAVDPTCTTEGFTAGEKCSVCGEIIEAQEIVPAKGHSEETIPAVEPTCTETGLTEGKQCSVCGEITEEQEIVPAKGHTYDDKLDADCNVCGAVRDVTCTHSWGEGTVTVAPTCTRAGSKTFTCALCGEVKVENLAALGHDAEEIPAVAPTCSAEGLTAGEQCSVCGEVLTEQASVPKLPHSEETIPAVKATCTKSGLTEGKKCSVCGTVTVAQQTVPATGHTYDNDSDATCNTCGEKREVESGGSGGSGGSSGGGGGGGSAEADYFFIWAEADKGGSISPEGSVKIQAGRGKTFTFKAESGYVIADVLVDGKSVGAVKEYTFKDVQDDHELVVQFRPEKCEGGIFCDSYRYKDLNAKAWYHEAVDAMLSQGLMKGTTSNTFSPDGTLTRAMLVVILYRMEGSPAISAAAKQHGFKDVKSGWYYDAVCWANSKGIVTGFDAKTFAPNDPITREQMAAILYRYARYREMDITIGEADSILKFKDVSSVSSYAVLATQWALNEGILSGLPDNRLAPKELATRAQAAKVLYAFL